MAGQLAQWASEGRARRRVRVIHDPPTDYERYACDWGYRNNVAAGELVRILDLAEQSPPPELQFAPGDWSLIDGRDVEPFTAWWDRHPEHHRSAGRAA